MSKVCIFDSETTDLHGVAVELGSVIFDSETFEVESVNQSFVKPDRPIHPEASCVHGITDEEVADAPDFDEVIKTIIPDDCDIVLAHNLQFDRRIVGEENFPSGVKQMCTLELARKLVPKDKFGSHKLGTLYYGYKLYLDDDWHTGNNSHRADFDALMTLSVLKKILQENNLTLDQAYELVKPLPINEQLCKMKKFRESGLTWQQVVDSDKGYCRWMIDKYDFKGNTELKKFLEENV